MIEDCIKRLSWINQTLEALTRKNTFTSRFSDATVADIELSMLVSEKFSKGEVSKEDFKNFFYEQFQKYGKNNPVCEREIVTISSQALLTIKEQINLIDENLEKFINSE